jgi:hypothetical protein
LLCHDDVIGSRRLSYVLYLTNPDKQWKPQWGGALRLYPTQQFKNEDGIEAIIPSPNFSVSIPPAWNQLSFFTIQPGLSFHDVEEVYHRHEGEDENDGGRIRMAISGWFHIPQKDEEGYEEGLEEELAEKSSLTQLQSKSDEYDLPKPHWIDFNEPNTLIDGPIWTESELDFLVTFINPSYLVPDTLEELSEQFAENSVVSLDNFLHPKFVEQLHSYISTLDNAQLATIPARPNASSPNETGTAHPPHKHRFLYRHAVPAASLPPAASTPLDKLLDYLLPSALFTRWLKYFTNLSPSRSSLVARRFRRGLDYTLATGYDDEKPQLEIMLGLTPSPGWGGDEDNDDDEDIIPAQVANDASNGENGEEINVGGYEVYMVGDEDEEDDDKAAGEASHTGAGHRRKADPAVYKASSGDEDDGVLFSMPASWNTLSIVLRDQGLLRFVKYVSESAKGDRWDVVGAYSIVEDDDD